METHCLGRTDLRVSRVGLGTVELGMPYGIGLPAPPPDTECIRLLHEAAEAGIACIDTAAAYGRSEELVGLAFGGRGDRPVIATKAATRVAPDPTPLRGQALRAQLEASVARSLTRLRLEQLDLLQFHSLEPEQLDDALFGAMDALSARGWVRWWGASTYGTAAPRAIVGTGARFATLQMAYSLLDRTLEDGVLPACRPAGIGVIVRSAFLKGVLSERYRALPAHLEPLRQTAAAAAGLAATAGLSLAEAALRFAVHSPYADVVLFGTAAPDELRANLRAAAAGPLPDELTAAFRKLRVEPPELLNPATWGL
jgi:aryl-alcohol dehydrogenase-like predicted oxidoreductase